MAKRQSTKPGQPKKPRKPPPPTGLDRVDGLVDLSVPTIEDYIKAASQYVRECRRCNASQTKAAQIRLSNGLAACLVRELTPRIPKFDGYAGERTVAGGLRKVKADVSEFHKTDGLRLAVELKPVNLAVGRAIWNRFGEYRAFAVNLHLKFPFAVIGGVLALPTYELRVPKEVEEAVVEEEESESDLFDRDYPGAVAEPMTVAETLAPITMAESVSMTPGDGSTSVGSDEGRKNTTHLIARAVDRLRRAGGRVKETDAAHLLEGVGVIVDHPDTETLHPTIPAAGSGLRWDEFVSTLVLSYDARFGRHRLAWSIRI